MGRRVAYAIITNKLRIPSTEIPLDLDPSASSKEIMRNTNAKPNANF